MADNALTAPFSGISMGGPAKKDNVATPFGQFGSERSFGGTYFDNPAAVQAASTPLMGLSNQMVGQYGSFLQDPTSHPLFQGALQGLLGSLMSSEQSARTGLADQFRSAGNMSSSVFANAGQGLEGDILRNRQTMASSLLSSLFPQMVGAMQGPMNQIPNLLQALKMQTNVGAAPEGTSNTRSNANSLFSMFAPAPAAGQPKRPQMWPTASGNSMML